MAIYKNIHTENFVQINNAVLRNTEMSLQAKSILSLILTFPADWKFTTSSLVKYCKESITAVRTAMNELIRLGYVERIRKRTKKGTFEYTFNAYETLGIKSNKVSDTETSKSDNPKEDNPVSEIPKSDAMDIYKEKENEKRNTKIIITKRESEEKESKPSEINSEEKETNSTHTEKLPFGKYFNVFITEETYHKFENLYGKEQTDTSIDNMSTYMKAHNKTYPNIAVRLEQWINEDIKKAESTKTTNNSYTSSNSKSKYKTLDDNDFDVDKYKIFINNWDIINAELEEQSKKCEEKKKREEQEREEYIKRRKAEEKAHFDEMINYMCGRN